MDVAPRLDVTTPCSLLSCVPPGFRVVQRDEEEPFPSLWFVSKVRRLTRVATVDVRSVLSTIPLVEPDPEASIRPSIHRSIVVMWCSMVFTIMARRGTRWEGLYPDKCGAKRRHSRPGTRDLATDGGHMYTVPPMVTR